MHNCIKMSDHVISPPSEVDTTSPRNYVTSPSNSVSPMTTSRRNKRKMTAPQRRSDAIKKICPASATDAPSDTEDDHIPASPHHMEMMTKQINSKRTTYVAPAPAPRKLVTPGGRSDGEERDSGGTGYSPSPSPEECSPTSLSGDRPTIIMPMAYDPMALYARPYPFGLAGIATVGLPPSTLTIHPGLHPASTTTTQVMPISVISSTSTTTTPSPIASTTMQHDLSPQDDDSTVRRNRKNYKNMTRARRVEANARERSRVHTISAAFESLRRAVPSYSYNQKLSKLAILRIACSYILALARLADLDYTYDQSDISFDECVDMCTSTIQSEGRARRRQWSQT